jgi:hypothetical protein
MAIIAETKRLQFIIKENIVTRDEIKPKFTFEFYSVIVGAIVCHKNMIFLLINTRI